MPVYAKSGFASSGSTGVSTMPKCRWRAHSPKPTSNRRLSSPDKKQKECIGSVLFGFVGLFLVVLRPYFGGRVLVPILIALVLNMKPFLVPVFSSHFPFLSPRSITLVRVHTQNSNSVIAVRNCPGDFMYDLGGLYDRDWLWKTCP